MTIEYTFACMYTSLYRLEKCRMTVVLHEIIKADGSSQNYQNNTNLPAAAGADVLSTIPDVVSSSLASVQQKQKKIVR